MNPQPPVRMLIDGRCGPCARTAESLRGMDRGRGLVVIVDAADERFDPAAFGLTRDEALTSIHAALPDGRVVAGMEALRGAYRALGRGWMLAPTAWPMLRPVFDRAYACFARNRYRFQRSARCDAKVGV